jgi:hypothetical protein
MIELETSRSLSRKEFRYKVFESLRENGVANRLKVVRTYPAMMTPANSSLRVFLINLYIPYKIVSAEISLGR